MCFYRHSSTFHEMNASERMIVGSLALLAVVAELSAARYFYAKFNNVSFFPCGQRAASEEAFDSQRLSVGNPLSAT